MRAMRGNDDVRHGDKEVRAEAGGKRIEDNASPSCIRPDLFVEGGRGEQGGKNNTLIKFKTRHLFIIVITTASNNRY